LAGPSFDKGALWGPPDTNSPPRGGFLKPPPMGVVADFPSGVGQHDQHEEDLEPDRGHSEEIEGDEVRHVIFQEGSPGGRGRSSRTHAILLNRGFLDGNPQLPQFAQNPRRPPPGIGRGDVPDQLSDFLRDRRPARLPPTEASPVVAKALALPAEHGRRLHEDQDFRQRAQCRASHDQKIRSLRRTRGRRIDRS